MLGNYGMASFSLANIRSTALVSVFGATLAASLNCFYVAWMKPLQATHQKVFKDIKPLLKCFKGAYLKLLKTTSA